VFYLDVVYVLQCFLSVFQVFLQVFLSVSSVFRRILQMLHLAVLKSRWGVAYEGCTWEAGGGTSGLRAQSGDAGDVRAAWEMLGHAGGDVLAWASAAHGRRVQRGRPSRRPGASTSVYLFIKKIYIFWVYIFRVYIRITYVIDTGILPVNKSYKSLTWG
jgi:hypothetical protein